MTFAPVWPYHYFIAGLSGFAVCLLLIHLLLPRKRRALGRHPFIRLAVVIFSLLTALSMTAAAYNPQLIQEPIIPRVHLVVAVDVSDSVLRDEEEWLAVLDDVGQLLNTAVNTMPEEMLAQGTGSLLTFGRGVNIVEREITLTSLPDAFRRLMLTDFAPGDATNIQSALEQAEQNIRRAGQRGVILLVTDGNQTEGNAWETAQTLARRGVPIYIYPLVSQSPALAITSAYLPTQIDGRAEANLRAILQNHSNQDVPARLVFHQNPGLDNQHARFGIAQLSEVSFIMPAENWTSLRQPIRFEGVGLQFVDLVLTPEGSEGEHRRRFYTHVTRPINVLAVGGDNRWITALSPENIIVTQITAPNLPPDYDFQEVDTIVISGVPATDFRPDTLEAIAQAVNDDGLGLLILNGDHAGGDEKTPTILMSYEDTPVEPLLPITTNPRVVFEEPPVRNVVILIDASGSMGGNRIGVAKEIATHIVGELLRPNDILDVVVFTHRADHIVDSRLMSDDGKMQAVEQINGIRVGGGTDPRDALALVAQRRMTHCGLIFISDGELASETLATRPDCRGTVFLVGYSDVPDNAPVRQLADPIPAPDNFSPAGIAIPYFDPEPRDKFFEPGEYTPLTTEYFSTQIDRLPIPDLPLDGTAVTALKNEDGVTLMAARPRFTDPVLAYKPNGAGYVGAFTTGIPPNWLESEAGRQAIEAWIKRTVPYVARDRYDLRLDDRGGDINLQIGLVAEVGNEFDITDLTVSLLIDGQSPVPVTMQREETAPGMFTGEIRLSRGETTQLATLLIRESGPHALSRPQRIPMLVAPAAPIESVATSEAYSYGLNENLLQAIAEVSGGVFAPPIGTSFFRSVPTETPVTEFWPYLSLLAAFFYLLSIASKRFES
jgi:Mg-chelatase subunit ChlD